MDRRQVQQAMDKAFAPLSFTPRMQAEVLSVARGEKKVKRKLSLGFVLAMALILMVLTAVAVVSIWETGRTMARLEQQEGQYIDWSIDSKIQVVTELMEAGYIPETGERIALREGTLTQQDALRIADEAIAALTGEDAGYASFLTVMQAVWGPFETWSAEQQAWYTQVSEEAGANTEGKTRYMQPDGAVTKEEALRIARQALAKGYNVPESVLDGYRVTQSYQIPEFAQPGDRQAYWYVQFELENTAMMEDAPFISHELFIHPNTGELLVSVEDILAQRAQYEELQQEPLRLKINEFVRSSGESKSFLSYSVQNKARWTADIAPHIKQFLHDSPDKADMMFNWDERASTVYAYGLPDDKAIPEEKALTLALDALQKEYDLSSQERELLQTGKPSPMAGAAYDVTDPAQPKWKFLFTMPTQYDADEELARQVKALYGNREYNRIYKVELDAYTGQVLQTLALPHMDSLLENIMDGYSKLF